MLVIGHIAFNRMTNLSLARALRNETDAHIEYK